MGGGLENNAGIARESNLFPMFDPAVEDYERRTPVTKACGDASTVDSDASYEARTIC